MRTTWWVEGQREMMATPTEKQFEAFRAAYKSELGHVNLLGDAVSELKRIWPLIEKTLLTKHLDCTPEWNNVSPEDAAFYERHKD